MFALGSCLAIFLVPLVAGLEKSFRPVDQCPADPLKQHEPLCWAPRLASPSLDGPHRCVDHYCVFSHRQFAGGLAVVTDQKYVPAVQRLMGLALSQPTAPPAGRDAASALSPPFYEAAVPGKGRGLIANRTIAAGERLMAMGPTMLAHLRMHNTLAPPLRDGLYDAAVQRLPAPRRRAFNRLVGGSVADVMDKNCFQTGVDATDEGGHLGCFVEAARFNHDCRPNAQYHVRNLTLSVVAVREIAAGTELTVSYIDVTQSREERQRRLLAGWGFRCTCSQCRLSDAEAALSDARVRRITALHKALDDPHSPSRDDDDDDDGGGGGGSSAEVAPPAGEGGPLVVTPGTGAELVRLYREERLDLYLGKAHTRAALNYALFGRTERAREEAARAVDALLREGEGEADGDVVSMRLLAREPKAHWTWGNRRRGLVGGRM